jgi:hypothetical protein
MSASHLFHEYRLVVVIAFLVRLNEGRFGLKDSRDFLVLDEGASALITCFFVSGLALGFAVRLVVVFFFAVVDFVAMFLTISQ